MALPAFAAAAALASLALGQATTARGGSVAFPPWGGAQSTINIVEWDANSLPRVYERSAQLPLTDEDVTKLSQAGFAPDELVVMIEQRRCACDASADGLIRLRKAGVDRRVLSAISLHALPPNRALQLVVTLDFTGESQSARDAYLYLFVEDGPVTRVLTANVDDLLKRRNAHEAMVDRSDLLIERTVRRIVLPGELPLKRYGSHQVLVVSSARPTLTHPSQLNAQERANARSYTIDYPRSSLQSVCRLDAGYKRDAELTDRWRFVGSRFECEWD
jgi:hypothetical protein